VAKVESEVFRPADACRIAEVAPYVLRYWETEFPALAEGKDKGAARFYTARDIKIITRIRELLYDEGFTVAGAKKRLEAELAEGRFDEGLATAPPLRDQRRKGPSPMSRVTDQPALLKISPPPAAAAAAKPAARAEAAEPAFDRKKLVRELKDIVKLLEDSRKD
jgi:DNA-binding transcriptional MerR regulator